MLTGYRIRCLVRASARAVFRNETSWLKLVLLVIHFCIYLIFGLKDVKFALLLFCVHTCCGAFTS